MLEKNASAFFDLSEGHQTRRSSHGSLRPVEVCDLSGPEAGKDRKVFDRT
jgi:hypothetical protein